MLTDYTQRELLMFELGREYEAARWAERDEELRLADLAPPPVPHEQRVAERIAEAEAFDVARFWSEAAERHLRHDAEVLKVGLTSRAWAMRSDLEAACGPEIWRNLWAPLGPPDKQRRSAVAA